MRSVLLALALLSCRTVYEIAPPREKPAPKPSDWKTDGSLRQDEGDAKCVAELPACKRAFGLYTMPPSPCAHRGSLCNETRPRSGRWSCECDQCSSDTDCAKGEYCGVNGPPCAHERYPTVCRKGERPPPTQACNAEPPPP